MDVSTANKALFVTMMVTVLSITGMALPYPILAPLFNANAVSGLTQFFGIPSNLLFALLLTIYPVGMFIGSMFIGSFSDVYGRRKVLMLSSVFSAFSYALSALAVYWERYDMLLMARFLTGLFEGNIAIGRAIVSDLHPVIDKTKAFSLIFAATYTGWLIGPVLGGYTLFLGQSAAFIIASICTALSVIAIYLWIPETHQSDKSASLKHIMAIAKAQNSLKLIAHRPIRVIALIYLLLCLGLSAFYGFFPLLLADKFSFISPEIANITLTQTAAMILFSVFIAPRLKAKCGFSTSILFGLITLGVSLILVFTVNKAYLFVYFFITGAAIGLYSGLLSAYISERYAYLEQGRLMGLLTSIYCLSSILIAPMGGAISSYSIDNSIIFGGILFSAGTLLFWRFSAKSQNNAYKAPNSLAAETAN